MSGPKLKDTLTAGQKRSVQTIRKHLRSPNATVTSVVTSLKKMRASGIVDNIVKVLVKMTSMNHLVCVFCDIFNEDVESYNQPPLDDFAFNKMNLNQDERLMFYLLLGRIEKHLVAHITWDQFLVEGWDQFFIPDSSLADIVYNALRLHKIVRITTALTVNRGTEIINAVRIIRSVYYTEGFGITTTPFVRSLDNTDLTAFLNLVLGTTIVRVQRDPDKYPNSRRQLEEFGIK